MASEEWSVEKWLKNIRMSKYKQAFRDNGYETAELCACLSEEDLDAIFVTNKNHRSTLFTHARKLKESLKSSCDAGDNKDTLISASLPESEPFNSAEVESQPLSSDMLSVGPSINLTDLADYSEPWSGASNVSTNDTSPMPKQKPCKKISSGLLSNSTDGRSSGNKTVPHMRPPVSPVRTESPTVKKDANTGMTRLQLKLKIRDELFNKNVVLSEKPYCREDGSPDENLMMDLATELSERFDVESLSMYDALQETWSNANKCSYSARSTKPKIKVPLLTTRSIDEAFGSPHAAAAGMPPHRTMKPTIPLLTACSLDNYDEPFDSTNTVIVTPTHKSLKMKKSATLSSSGVKDFPNYDEPFDYVSNQSKSSDKKKGCNTLPSPRTRGSVVDTSPEGSESPIPSPKNSPRHTPPSKAKFSIFKRKDKKRSSSVVTNDLQHVDEWNKRSKEKESSPGLLAVSSKTKCVSVEDLTEMGVVASVEQKAYLRSGLPPPLPSLRTKQANGSSGESDCSPHFSDTQRSTSKKLEGAINTLPVLNRKKKSNAGSESSTDTETLGVMGMRKRGMKHASSVKSFTTTQTRLSRTSDDEDSDSKSWLTESKKSTKSEVIPGSLSRSSKNRTSQFFSRIFKNKTLKGRERMLRVPHRTSVISNCSSISSEGRERRLTASISMPDVTVARNNALQKVSASQTNDYNDHNYSEVLDVVPPEREQDGEGRSKESYAKDKPRKKPPKPHRVYPWADPSPPTMIISTASLNDILGDSPCNSPPLLSSSSPTTDTLAAMPPISLSSVCTPPARIRQKIIHGNSNSRVPNHFGIAMNPSTSSLSSSPGRLSVGGNFMGTWPTAKTVDSLNVTSYKSVKYSNKGDSHSLTATSAESESGVKNSTTDVSLRTPPLCSGTRPEEVEVTGGNKKKMTSLPSKTKSKTDRLASAASPQQGSNPILLPSKPNRTLPRPSNPTTAKSSDDVGTDGGVMLSSSPSKPTLNIGGSKTDTNLATPPKSGKVMRVQYQRSFSSSTSSSKDDSASVASSISPLSPRPQTLPVIATLPLDKVRKPPPKPTQRTKTVATTGQTLSQPQQERKSSTLEKRTFSPSPKDQYSSSTAPSPPHSKTSTSKNFTSPNPSTLSASPKPVLLPKPLPRTRISRGTLPEHAKLNGGLGM